MTTTINIHTAAPAPPDDTEAPAPVKTEAVADVPDVADKEREYFTGGAIKALGDTDSGKIGGYLIAWGSPAQRDRQGEYFTPDTDLHLDWYPERPVLYHHGLDGEARAEVIGKITTLRADERGVYAEAQLDMSKPRVRRIYDEVKKDTLFWSSGSVAHLVDVAKDGHIRNWPLIEGSLTPTPAEPQRTKVDAIKTACDGLLCETPTAPEEPPAKEGTPTATDDSPDAPRSSKSPPRKRAVKTQIRKPTRGHKNMPFDSATIEALREKGFNAEQILDIMTTMADGSDEPPMDEEAMMSDNGAEDIPPQLRSAANAAQPANTNNGLTAENIQQLINAEVKSQVEASQRTAPATDDTPDTTQTPTTRIEVASKYQNLSAADMGFMKAVMDAGVQIRGRGSIWVPGGSQDEASRFYREMVVKAEREHIAFPDAALKTVKGIKADEVNYSTLSSYGDEFVPTLWSADLWRTPRIDNPVYANLVRIDMPSNPYTLPIESTDPTIYAVGETADENQLGINDSNAAIPDTQVGTSNTTMTAGKLGARIIISEELVEDSIIPIIPIWREQTMRAMENARDLCLLSADATTGTSNINNDGGSITAATNVLYGGGDGLLHLPLVTDTTLGVDMGGVAPTLAKIREARSKLNRTLYQKRGELVYFCDPETLLKLESLDEAVVSSINGVGSTFEGREVKGIDGIMLFPTDQMSLATSTGVVSSTAGNNTLGRLLLAHRRSWYAGFRRDVRLTVDYLHRIDAHILVITMRMALARRADDVASLLYNIAV